MATIGSILRLATALWVSGACACGGVAAERPSAAQASVPQATLALERIFADPPLAGRPPFQLRFSPDSRFLAFLRSSETDSEVAELWATQVPGGPVLRLARASDILGAARERLSDAERQVQERLHVRHSGITSWNWCGKTTGRILFPLSSQLYLVSADTGELKQLTRSPATRLDARCSPTGTLVTFVSGGDLYAIDVATGTERRLTEGATPTVSHGLAEFVAQEEMERYTGYFWSPEGKRIAWLEVDESRVALKTRHRIRAEGAEMVAQRYPAAGTPNAQVKVFVLDLSTGVSSPMPVPTADGYIARVGWFGEGVPWVQWQSRDQRHVQLLSGTTPSFTPKLILQEDDPDWVELNHNLKSCDASGQFTWTSERSGTAQLYVGDREGRLRLVTSGAEPVLRVLFLDDSCSRALITRATDGSRQQHVYSVDLSTGQQKQVTREEGWHSALADDSGRYLVDSFSQFGVPPRVRLLSTDGTVLRELEGAGAEDSFRTGTPAPEWVDLSAEDGTTLHGVLLPPASRKPGSRYPVIVHVYGGPFGHLAAKRWSRDYLYYTFLIQRGCGVFLLDNRGGGNRERAFSRALHYRFGDIEYRDQVRGVEYLRTLPWVDPNRIGIWGWSYGGYVSALSILQPNNPFRAAVAIAPVADWRLYDTHYTERYLGMPSERSALYDRASLVSRAAQLSKPLLVMHGMADDNVLLEHSLQLIATLQQRSLPFQLMVYPGGAHGLKGRGTQVHVFKTMTAFFDRELAASQLER